MKQCQNINVINLKVYKYVCTCLENVLVKQAFAFGKCTQMSTDS